MIAENTELARTNISMVNYASTKALQPLALHRMHNGLTFEQYIAIWQERLAQPMKGMDREARRYLFYRRYNMERAGRVEAAYEMSDALKAAVDAIDAPQSWLVLTEDWCVDSAFSLPIISEAISHNPNVNMRILLRDENLDVMDRYLTNGGRSIPKLVVFDEAGQELMDWGPRPDALTRARAAWASEGVEGAMISQRSITWYEAGGWHHVDAELADALNTVRNKSHLAIPKAASDK